jgi:hypothetical protein
MNKNYQVLPLFLAACVSILLTGCAHFSVDFNLTNDSFKPKGKTIAVLSGTKETHNTDIVNQVTDALQKSSRYQVISQSTISKVVQPYPQTIKGPYKSAYFQIDTDWNLGDRQKIAKIQKSLGVDYLYVIWAPIAVTRNGDNFSRVYAVAQLFELTTEKIVAQAEIGLMWGGGYTHYAKDGTNEIANQLAQKTGMAK